MKKELIGALADRIESAPDSTFTMIDYLRIVDPDISEGERNHIDPYPRALSQEDCGTAGCIAGWTISEYALTPEDPFADEATMRPAIHAAAILGLNDFEAFELFCPEGEVTTFWCDVTGGYLDLGGPLEYMEGIFTKGVVVAALRALAAGEVTIHPVTAVLPMFLEPSE